jgi:hypothetical protein
MTAVPAYLAALFNKGEDLFSASTAGIKGLSRPAHISLITNSFSLVSEKGERAPVGREINVIIVGANPTATRIFYGAGKDFDPADPNPPPPICVSDNGVGPSVNSSEPQNLTCMGCKHAAWGSSVSKITGKSVPACSERKKLVVLYGRTDPLTNEVRHELYQFVVPPKSLKNFREYVKVIEQHKSEKVSLNMVVTTIKFDPKLVGLLQFSTQAFVDPETAPAVFKAMAADLSHYSNTDDEAISSFKSAGAVEYTEKEQKLIEEIEREEPEDVEEEEVEEEIVEEEPEQEPPPMAAKRGRPPGAKNKPKMTGQPNGRTPFTQPTVSPSMFGMQGIEGPKASADETLDKAMDLFRKQSR